MDTLNKWVAIKKTTEKLLTTKGTLYGARTAEVRGLKELVELKDERIKTLQEMNLSYEQSLGTCQQDRATLSKKLSGSKAVNKVLVLAAGVLVAVVIIR